MSRYRFLLRRSAWLIVLLVGAARILIPSIAQAQTSSCAAGAVDYNEDDGNDGTDVEQVVCLYYDSQSGMDATVETDNYSYSDWQDPGSLWVFGVGGEGQLVSGTDYTTLWDSGMQLGNPSDSGGNSIFIDSGSMTSTNPVYYLNGNFEECQQQPLQFDASGCSWNGANWGMSVELDLRSPATVNLTTSGSPSVAGQPVTLTAMITPSAAATGTVDFDIPWYGTLGIGTVSPASVTNLVPYSSNFVNWNWKTLQVTPNATAAPDGSNTASLLTVGPAYYVGQWGFPCSPGPVTHSVWLERNSANPGASVWLSVRFINSQNSELILTGTTFTPTANWQRFSETYTAPAGTTSCWIGIEQINSSGGAATSGSVYAWGAQVEQASSAGPYIATGSSSQSWSGGIATLKTSKMQVGGSEVSASWAGNDYYTSAQSNVIIQNVTPAAPTLSVSCPNAYYGEVQCTLSLGNTAFSNTGICSYSYSIDGGPSQEGPYSLWTDCANVASIGVLVPGSHSVQVSWPGDSYNEPASAQAIFTVQKDPGLYGGSCTSTSCSFWMPEGVTVGNPEFGIPAGYMVGATGVASFTLNGKYLTTAAPFNGVVSAQLPNNLEAGQYTLTAKYAGDANYAATTLSVTPSVSAGPTPDTPPVSVSCSPNPITDGLQQATCTAMVGNLNQSPAGMVTFSSNSTVVATSPIAAGSASATLLGKLPPGADTIVANFTCTENYLTPCYPSSSGSTTLTVLPQSTFSIACSPNRLPYGSQSTTCTATANSGATGNVKFMIQGGAWTTPTPWVTLGLSNGSASVVGFGGVAAGTYEVTADYSGDGNNTAASASTTLSIENAGPGSSIYYSYSVPDGGYQSNGNVMAYTDSVMGSWNFGYDLLNRLVTAGNTSQPAGAAWAPYFCWAYDAFGNRLQQSTSNAAFTQGTGSCTFSGTEYQNTWASYTNQNQIASTNAPGFVWSPAYDGAGNITDDGSNQYLYDAEGRICAVASDGYGTGYLYDAAGNRVAKGTITSLSCDITTNGFQQTTGYVVGPGGEQITEVGANSTIWNHTNVYAEGKQIGTYDSAGLHLYVDDPLGTRRAQVLDSSGTLEAVYQSLPFGDGLNSIPYATGATDPTENHFTGKERDTESGNDYMFARYYNSATGRFLSPDWSAKEEPVPYAKLEYPQTLNLYSYVLNNPMTHSDPDGHKCGDAGQPACTAPGTTATPTSPQSDAKARATQAGEAAVNFTLAATKINTAIKTAPTSETVVGGLATAYLGISATGNAVAGTLQAGGAATGHTKVAEEGAEAVSTVTSVVGFGILLKTGDMNKAATGAAVEGILTSRPEDLATGGTLERAAKVADFGQNVSKVWSSIKSTVTEWIHPVAVQ